MHSLFKIVFCFTTLFYPLASSAEDLHHNKQKQQQSGVTTLSTELRALLSKEMVALQKGMQAIVPAYVAGNWAEIEAIALKMENSYILKQSLNEHQIHELHSSLSAEFLKLDQDFHYYAGMLNHVAAKKKVELVGFYITKLNETCLNCHSQFATHKFPLLAPQKTNEEHHH